MKPPTLALTLIIAIGWPTSLAATYWLTRDKWHDLGAHSGAITGQSEILTQLCDLAHPGPAPDGAVWQLAIKSSIVELAQSDGTFTLHCRR